MDISGGVSAPRSTEIESWPLIIGIIIACFAIYGIFALFTIAQKNKNNHLKDQKLESNNNKLQCQICDSHDLIKENDYIICQNCGCKYTIEEARNSISQIM